MERERSWRVTSSELLDASRAAIIAQTRRFIDIAGRCGAGAVAGAASGAARKVAGFIHVISWLRAKTFHRRTRWL
jgi:hypothetical protein